jgi:hypothetical protein
MLVFGKLVQLENITVTSVRTDLRNRARRWVDRESLNKLGRNISLLPILLPNE